MAYVYLLFKEHRVLFAMHKADGASCYILTYFWWRCKEWVQQTLYSDTSANEDNSFRIHTR